MRRRRYLDFFVMSVSYSLEFIPEIFFNMILVTMFSIKRAILIFVIISIASFGYGK